MHKQVKSNQQILVLGASGFIGFGIFEYLSKLDYNVLGLGTKNKPWRIQDDLISKYVSLDTKNLTTYLNEIAPKIIINCIAHGAYSFQNDVTKITNSNFLIVNEICEWACKNGAFIIHTGTSSEYGINSAGPLESEITRPNSVYAITKLAATNLFEHYSNLGLSSIVLRLYSVYGPKEDPSRLIPAILRGIIQGNWPKFTDSNISRDFIYLEDLCKLITKIIDNLNKLSPNYFEIFNVGYGKKITIFNIIEILKEKFMMPNLKNEKYDRRHWDISDWYANIDKVTLHYDWRPEVDLVNGLNKLKKWYMINDNLKYLNEHYSENKS